MFVSQPNVIVDRPNLYVIAKPEATTTKTLKAVWTIENGHLVSHWVQA
jgi:hypothetical protein